MDNEYSRRNYLTCILCQTRAQAGKSQEYMALEMGVARKTIQNWEKGASAPNIDQMIMWFKILNISPLPYLFQYVHPEMEKISSKDDVEHLRKSLVKLISDMPAEGVRQLLYLFYGDHGSSPRAVLNMITAHLHTDMKDRVTVGNVVLKNYEVAMKRDAITGKGHVLPDVEFLRESIELGEKAAVENHDAYFKIDGNVDALGDI